MEAASLSLTRRARGRAPEPGLTVGTALEATGRTLAVVVPVVAVEAVVGHGSTLERTAAMLVATAVWLGFLNLGFAAGRTTLSTLGPRIGVFRGALLGLVAMAALGAFVPALSFGVAGLLALALAIAFGAACWETAVERWFRTPTRLLLVGPRAGCANVLDEFTREESKAFELVGIVEDDASAPHGLTIGSVDDLAGIIERTRPELVALVPGCERPKVFDQLLDAAAWDFKVLELAHFYEHAFGRVPVRDLTNAWFMSVLHFYGRPYSRFVKRASDIVAATILLVLTLPLFPILVLLVRTSPGPVFYRQVRIGEHGELFTMYKFRTMRVDAERPGEAVWAAAVDPRTTRPGRIMRRTRLDELPQILNILRGDMSFVGPRPERPEFLEELVESVPYWTHRHLVKPGITGWAQVNRGYTTDSEGTLEKLSYDLWYVRHRSLMVDIAICMRTLAAVLRGTHKTSRAARDYPRTALAFPHLTQTGAAAVDTVEDPFEVERVA